MHSPSAVSVLFLNGSAADKLLSVDFGKWHHIRVTCQGSASEVRMTNDAGLNANAGKWKLSMWPIPIAAADVAPLRVFNFDGLDEVMYFSRDTGSAFVHILMWGPK